MRKKTNFITLNVERVNITADEQGFPLGNGKCSGVILRANILEPNGMGAKINLNTAGATVAFYVGDSNRQECEVQVGVDSPLFICSDLSEIFIRIPRCWQDIGKASFPYAIHAIVYDL